MRYAALRTLIAVITGIILAEQFNIPLIYLIIGILVGMGLDRFTKGYSIYAAIVFVAMLNSQRQKSVSIETLYNQPIKIIGTIIDEPITKERMPRYTVELKKVIINEKSYAITEKIFAKPSRKGIQLFYGDLIAVSGKIEPFNFPRNPNLYDLNKYYARRGILGQIKFTNGNINIIAQKKGNPIAQYLIFPLRRYFFKVINHYLQGSERALYAGILLGEKQDLPYKLKLAFSDTGLAHILAVSGLHVGILVGACLLLFSVIGLYRGKWYTWLVLSIVVFWYVGITGFKASAVRSGLMTFLASLGFGLERKTELLSGVFVAGLIILLLSPLVLFEIGFQLSFAATIALIIFAPKIFTIFAKITASSFSKRYLLAPIAVTLAAQLGVAPLLVYYFCKLPVITILANLLIVPLVGFALPLAFVVVLFHFLLPILAKIFAETLWFTLHLIIFITNKLDSLRFASINLPKPSIGLVIVFYLLTFLLFYFNQPLKRKIFMLILLLTLNILVWPSLFS